MYFCYYLCSLVLRKMEATWAVVAAHSHGQGHGHHRARPEAARLGSVRAGSGGRPCAFAFSV